MNIVQSKLSDVMAHGDAWEGKWREKWRMEWVASTLHTTSEHGVFSITTADAQTLAASSWMNWRPPTNLNGFVHFAERWNLVSARVPSYSKCGLPTFKQLQVPVPQAAAVLVYTERCVREYTTVLARCYLFRMIYFMDSLQCLKLKTIIKNLIKYHSGDSTNKFSLCNWWCYRILSNLIRTLFAVSEG
jgi:hypothetical protein